MASPAESQDRNRANSTGELYWEPPWDPGICRRKLLNVQKMRDLQDTARRGHSGSRVHEWLQTTEGHDGSVVDRYVLLYYVLLCFKRDKLISLS